MIGLDSRDLRTQRLWVNPNDALSTGGVFARQSNNRAVVCAASPEGLACNYTRNDFLTLRSKP